MYIEEGRVYLIGMNEIMINMWIRCQPPLLEQSGLPDLHSCHTNFTRKSQGRKVWIAASVVELILAG